MPRAPKKYADSARTEVTPQWRAWNQERQEEAKERSVGFLLGQGQDPAIYYPQEYGKDLGDGAWIFVIDPPRGVAHDFDVPLLSMWWGRPHRLNSGKLNGAAPYQAVITTPAGDLHLWPHEYTICSQPEALIGEEGTHIHSLGGAPVLDEEQVFYLQSRGISRHDATMLLFSQIRQQNFIYVTFDPHIVDLFAGVGTSLRSGVAGRWHDSRTADAG